MAQRNTMQKNIIYAALTELRNHPTADMVYDRVHTDYPSISRATVFRVLRQMAENGQISKVGLFDGADCFDHNTSDHCHARCTCCHRIFDIFLEKPSVSSFLNSDVGDFLVTDYSLQFIGLCFSCHEKISRKADDAGGQ